MKKRTVLYRASWVYLVLVGVLAFETPAQAQKPINLALVTPIQIFPADQSIKGLRLNLIYGRNAAMTGLDLGLVNHVTGPTKGAQFGLVNITESFVGYQEGFVNINDGEFEGFQYGGFNKAGRINGLQLGLVNYSERAHGVQVGLINIIKEGGQFPVMVIVNWGFN